MKMKVSSSVKFFLVGISIFFATTIIAQNSSTLIWKSIFEKEIPVSGKRVIIPKKYKVFHASEELKNILFSAPNEKTISLANSSVTIELPMPNGNFETFKIVQSPVMEKELVDQFPQIKTFNAMSISSPGTYAKLDWTEFGFHGMIFTPEGRVFIDPYIRNNTSDYITYYTSDYEKKQEDRMIPECGGSVGQSTERIANPVNSVQANIFAGTTLRTYRLAIACTGEYAVAATGVASPTTAQILSVVTTTVNRVDGVYETEAAIKFVLIANETTILYPNPSTDPFTGNDQGNILIGESQTVINSNIGSANYDIGHTFSTGGGGLAGLGVVCNNTNKARGITGSPNPVGDAYDIDYVAHEIGHQFGGNHSYNQCQGNATENPGTMVEPGGGVTIMGYAGICAAADNIANNSIAYFHTISFDEIMTFSNTGGGNTCPTKPATGNNIPVVTGSAAYTIPKSTPFTLTGSAIDADGDVLTYSWEEIDNNSTPHAVGTAAPYFRSLVPSSSPSRTFPRLATILTGATSNLGEYLPSTAQTLNFRLTARDNKMGGGGVHYAGNQVIIASSGPFAVTYPNATGITWASGSTQTVTWSVNSTNTAPVNCANVNILLSIDGGNTFPTVLASNTPNDGTQAITVPAYATNKTTCRVKVEAVGNIFFDISNNNFTITATTSPIASVAISQTAGTNPMCPGASATFSATPTNGGTAPTYQWQVSGVNVGTNSNTYTTTTLTNGQTVTCIMTSNLAGVVGSPATSNTITMVVGNTVPSVTIAGPTVMCSGSSVTYTATPVNGGGAPTYQWQVNGGNVGTNSSTFTTSSLTNGQNITCVMTSNAGCQATPTVTSNTLTVVVSSSASLPLSQNFEGATFPPTGWIIENSDAPSAAWTTAGAKGLEKRAAGGNTGSATGCVGIECYNYNTDTTKLDNLISVPVNLTGATSPKMTFKRAYKNYVDAANPTKYQDELKIYISTDCGSTFGSAIYFKKGAQLASNGTLSSSGFTPTVAADWKTDTVNLSAYVNQSIIVKFEIGSKYGNNIYLDDINFSSTAAAIPVANFTAAATKCAGTPIAFTDASTNSPTGWAWTSSPSTGVTITSASSQNPTITFTNAGTYTVSLIASNSSGSSTSYTQAVVVNARPTVTATSNPTSGTVCAGTQVTLTGGGASTYTWSGGVTNATAFTPTITTTYTVTGTATNGCTNTATKLITVNALPTVTATSNPTSGTVCAGTQVTLTGGGASSYTWTGGVTNATAFTPTVTTTYTVTGTDANGCTNTATKLITVNSLPTVTATSNPVSGTVCAGTQVTLTGGGASTYTWTGGVINATAFTPTITATYTVTGTDANGCSNTATKVVTVNPIPVMTNATTANACTGIAVNFALTSNVTSTYSWVAANNANVTGESTTPQSGSTITNTLSISNTTPRTVVYSVTPTSNGCTGAVQTVTITVNPLPTVTATSNPASGTVCAGTQVTLTGGGASTYAWSGGVTNATAFTPTITTTYTVTGTATTGCSNTATKLITVNNAPVVTATSNPVSGTVCAGTQVTLTGGGASTYTWTGGVTNATAFTPTITATYTVTGTDANGCTNTATKLITVNNAPTVTATSNPVSGTVCAGTQVTLTGGGASTYTWTGGVNNATAFTPTITATYTVTGTAANGCSSTATKLITVNSLPVVTVNSPSTCSGVATSLTANGALTYTWSNSSTGATISVSPTANTSYTVTGTDANGCVNNAVSNVTVTSAPNVTVNSPTICAGQSVILTGNGATSFSWSGGETTNAITVNPTSTTSYTVIGSNGPSCQNTAIATVTVNDLPIISVTAVPTGASVCAGEQITLSGNGGTLYNWSGGITDGVAFVPSTSLTYTLTGTDANGCSNTAIQSVTVNSLPTVSASSNPSSAIVCSGSNITLNGNGAATYTWTGGIDDGVTFAPSNSQSYTVTGVDANGCSNTFVVDVTVTNNSQVTAVSSVSSAICSGGTVTLAAANSDNYTWMPAAGLSSTIGSTVTANPTSTTTYTVTGTIAGCTSTIANVTVDVNPLPPAPTVSQNGTDLTTDATTGIQWYYNGSPMPGETNPSITPTQNGNYEVVVTDVNGCSSTSQVFTLSSVGISEITNSNINITIIPNPSNGLFTLSVSNLNTSSSTLVIKNVLGQVILDEKLNSTSLQKQVDLREFAKGVYFVTIISNQNYHTIKFVTQ